MTTAEKPYTVEPKGGGRVVVRFVSECNQLREEQHEEELQALVEDSEAVVCDLSETEHIASEWLRWLARMTAKADRMGKTFALAGVKDTVLKTADYIGVKEKLHRVKRVEEGWNNEYCRLGSRQRRDASDPPSCSHAIHLAHRLAEPQFGQDREGVH